MANIWRGSHEQIKKRIEAVIKKAEKGDTRSMHVLARCYTSGDYLPKDIFAAEAWLRKIVELDDDDNYAKKVLARLLTDSKGVMQDLEEAFDLYHDLMFDCDLDGMTGVANAYKYGLGVYKDEEKASYFLKHAFNIALDLNQD